MVSKIILVIFVLSAQLTADTRTEIDRLFRQASSGEIRFTKLVQPSKDSLSAMKDSAAKYLVSKLSTTDAREALTLVDIYRGIGTAATPYLVAALKTESKFQLRTTCRCLADIKDTAAIDALLAVASHPDYTVRSEAITAIGKSGGGATTAARLEPFLQDSIPYVRKSCVAGLGLLKAESSIPLLITALGDRHFAVRLTAYDALVSYDSLSTSQIVALLDTTQNAAITALAIRLAGELKIQASVNRVEQYLENRNPTLRGWAVWSWARLEGKRAHERLAAAQKTEADLFVKSLLTETLMYIDTLKTHE